MIDTDYHTIVYNDIRKSIVGIPITIGNKIWIGCNVTILKGTIIGHGCVIGANSLLSKHYTEDNRLIAGNPASVLKEIKGWEV